MTTQNSTVAPDMVIETSTDALYQPLIDEKSDSKANPTSTQGQSETIQAKYTSEREKRLRDEGNAQYVHLAQSEKFKHLARDCWIDRDQTPRLALHNGMHTKVFIVGGGFAGILHAVRLVQAGIKADDIIIADAAGGYGGTWYWNRYPGLMCDVESYIYLPLLEETGYMPKHKYSYGSEIRTYVNQIAAHWNLENRGAFQQSVQQLTWNDSDNHWQVKTQDITTNETVELTADFVVVAPGLLSKPKLTEFAGMEEYKGHIFHTARWDYNYTGGSPEDSSLIKLKGKKVGIIGTGATAIQSIPHLAKWVEELYVFQRTPSAVDQRGQRATDPKEFAEVISKKKDWQQERNKNFNSFITNEQPPPRTDMVDDGWSHMPSMSAIVAGPKPVTQDKIVDHIESLHSLDLPRQERVRDRVSQIVKDPDTASKLKPWYPGWCKRPCFHDDYLPVFNQPHVYLVDTSGKGIDSLTSNGIIANGREFPLDCIIFGTGYDLESSLSPTARASVTTHGRNGISLDDKWQGDLATLHGILTHDFPNLFFTGPTQAAASANYSNVLDQLAKHCAYIISQALTHALHTPNSSTSKSPIVEPTREAEEEWATRIMSTAVSFAAIGGCTPGYLNGEGAVDRMTMDQQIKMSRMSLWGKGINDFVQVLEDWRKEGLMDGLEVTVV